MREIDPAWRESLQTMFDEMETLVPRLARQIGNLDEGINLLDAYQSTKKIFEDIPAWENLLRSAIEKFLDMREELNDLQQNIDDCKTEAAFRRRELMELVPEVQGVKNNEMALDMGQHIEVQDLKHTVARLTKDLSESQSHTSLAKSLLKSTEEEFNEYQALPQLQNPADSAMAETIRTQAQTIAQLHQQLERMKSNTNVASTPVTRVKTETREYQRTSTHRGETITSTVQRPTLSPVREGLFKATWAIDSIMDSRADPDSLPHDILVILRDRKRDWDTSRVIWYKQQKGDSCINQRIMSRSSIWRYGQQVCCHDCLRTVRPCVVLQGAGKVSLLPVPRQQRPAHVQVTDVAYWVKKDLQ